RRIVTDRSRAGRGTVLAPWSPSGDSVCANGQFQAIGEAPMALIDLAMGLGLIALAGSVTIVPDAGAKPAATDKTDKACTPEDIVGRYVIVSGEKDGLKEPEERIKGTVVTFAKDSVIVADKDKKELYSATYKLDSTKNPSTIIMTSRVESSAGEIARGLVKK